MSGATGPDDGGRAFPNDGAWANGHAEGGMSMRDYFAAHALSGWLASYGPTAEHPAVFDNTAIVAQHSYAMADAMLAARAVAPHIKDTP